MGNFFSAPIIEVSGTDVQNTSTQDETHLQNKINDPRSPTAEVKRTPLNNLQQNNREITTSISSETPILKKDPVTMRNKLLKKMHSCSLKENKTK
uniref:Uncharacterized protein n=1 Tax=Strongyloides stercoralis TaxID=6248 RepID=A0A0K0DWC5_STRER